MNKTIVICIDEFDSIIDVAPVAEQGRIIGLANALVEAGNLPVRLLITMTRTPPLPEAEASPLFNKYAPVRLHPFSRTDFEAMLRGLIDQDALALPEEDRDRLFELSGGWPYFVKLLLTSISGEISERGWLDLTVEKALHNPVIEPTMRQIYDIYMDDAEKSILLLLAERGGRLTPAEVNTLGPNCAAAAARLCERDFLIYQKDGTYGFRIGFIGQWLPGWFSFEDEKEKHNLAALLQRIQRMNDPWADGPAPTVVTDEDLADIL